ncbi:MAG: DUF4260 domain-containing protein, partial [Chitinophagaceae bacterium]
AAMLGLSIYILTLFHVDWWWWLVLFIGPDISMIGYAAGNIAGAVAYNLFHHKGVAIAILVVGYLIPDIMLQITGVILFGHSSMDRLFGYGLKTDAGFKYTHLGMIGKK